MSRSVTSLVIVALAFGGFSTWMWFRTSSLERDLQTAEAKLSSTISGGQEQSQVFQAQVDSTFQAFQMKSDSLEIEIKLRMEKVTKLEKAADKEANWLASVRKIEEGKFYEVFKKLRPYKNGDNQVDSSYVKSFVVTPKPVGQNSYYSNDIRVRLVNETKDPIQPAYRVVLINKYGFVTEQHLDRWSFNKIGPGEVRFHDGELDGFRFGEPVYFYVEILK